MSLAAVPAYLIARRVVGKWLALLAALLTVAVPSMVYTATVMTENAYYPVFLLAALALVALLERPTTLNHVAFFAALGLAYLTRSQAVVSPLPRSTAPLLLGALPSAEPFRATLWAVPLALRDLRRRRAAPRRCAGRPREAAELAARLVRGASARAATTSARRLHFVVYHAAELDLYLGVIPVAAAIVLTARARSLDRAAAGAARRHDRARRPGRSSSSAPSRRASPTGSRSGTRSRSRRCS